MNADKINKILTKSQNLISILVDPPNKSFGSFIVGTMGFEPPTSSSEVYIYNPRWGNFALSGANRRLATFIFISMGEIRDD